MTQLGESFVPPDLELKSKHDENDCPFCQKSEPDNRETIYNGDSKVLREALGKAPIWKLTIDGMGEVTSVPNAHHLIPAEASLHGKRAHGESHASGEVLPKHAIMKYMSKGASGSKVTGDIGYDVNKGHNGIWLPSIPEAFKKIKDREGKDDFIKTWSALSEPKKKAVAESFMKNTRLQWHQTHKDYSNRVEKWLDNFVKKLEQDYVKKCPETSKGDDKHPPPLGLLSRLRGLSGFLKSHLKGSPENWADPLFTSTLAKNYHDS